jgi:hypothetical protein
MEGRRRGRAQGREGGIPRERERRRGGKGVGRQALMSICRSVPHFKCEP